MLILGKSMDWFKPSTLTQEAVLKHPLTTSQQKETYTQAVQKSLGPIYRVHECREDGHCWVGPADTAKHHTTHATYPTPDGSSFGSGEGHQLGSGPTADAVKTMEMVKGAGSVIPPVKKADEVEKIKNKHERPGN